MDYATKTEFKKRIDQQDELLNRAVKARRNLTLQEQAKFDALEVEIVAMEEGRSISHFEEVPVSDINDDDAEKVNDLIAFCSNDLNLSGVNARFFREYYDDSCRKYSGQSFSNAISPLGFVRPDAPKTIWLSPEAICHCNKYIDNTRNIESTVCHEVYHVHQLNSGKPTDEDTAWEYARLAVTAHSLHYNTVSDFCDYHNIEKSCG